MCRDPWMGFPIHGERDSTETDQGYAHVGTWSRGVYWSTGWGTCPRAWKASSSYGRVQLRKVRPPGRNTQDVCNNFSFPSWPTWLHSLISSSTINARVLGCCLFPRKTKTIDSVHYLPFYTYRPSKHGHLVGFWFAVDMQSQTSLSWSARVISSLAEKTR